MKLCAKYSGNMVDWHDNRVVSTSPQCQTNAHTKYNSLQRLEERPRALRQALPAIETGLPDEALDDRSLAVRPYACPLEIPATLAQSRLTHCVWLATRAARRMRVVDDPLELHVSIVLEKGRGFKPAPLRRSQVSA